VGRPAKTSPSTSCHVSARRAGFPSVGGNVHAIAGQMQGTRDNPHQSSIPLEASLHTILSILSSRMRSCLTGVFAVPHFQVFFLPGRFASVFLAPVRGHRYRAWSSALLLRQVSSHANHRDNITDFSSQWRRGCLGPSGHTSLLGMVGQRVSSCCSPSPPGPRTTRIAATRLAPRRKSLFLAPIVDLPSTHTASPPRPPRYLDHPPGLTLSICFSHTFPE
jgi:hypothetical protein